MDYGKSWAIVAFGSLVLLGAAYAEPANLDSRVAAFEKGLRPAVRMATAPKVRWTIKERMKHYKIPGVSLAIIENGKVAFAKAYGVKEAGTNDKVNTETVFSVGSLSKMGAATAVLKLTAKGVLDLDKDVNQYLKTWKVPENDFTKAQAVTLRGLMSHTAGLTLHGFGDFKPGEALPTVVNTLDGTGPSDNVPVRAFYQPGTDWSYSGGGTTVTQLVLTDMMGKDFPAVTKNQVFDDLGMARSTYQNPLPASHGNIAKAHDENGDVTALSRGWHAFPEMAASGLWTTPTEYALMMLSWMDSYHGKDGSFLPQSVAREMMSNVAHSPHGLGPVVRGHGMDRRFRHSGSNESYQAFMEGHLERGTGFVIFTNGVDGDALYDEIRRAVYDAYGWPYEEEIVVPTYEVKAETLEAYAGVYQVEDNGKSALSKRYLGKERTPTYKVSVKDGDLLVKGRKVLPVGPNQFVSSRNDIYYGFVRNLEGNIESLTIRRGEDTIAFDRQGD